MNGLSNTTSHSLRSQIIDWVFRTTGLSPLFLLFLVGGVLNTLFGYAVFLLLLTFGLGLGAALVGSTLAGILFNFQTSRRLVFATSGEGLLAPFIAVYLTMLAINYGALLGLTHFGVVNWAAQGLMVPLMALLSFFAQRNLVFRTNQTG